MENNQGLKILFIINPISGGKKKIDWETEVRKHFKNTNHTTEFFMLTGRDDNSSIQYWFQKFKPDRVVAVGGDGTVSMVAKEMLGSELPLSILPAGSANGMAKELRIPDDPDKAIELIVKGHIRCCDVIMIDDEDICLHLADVGLNARLIKYFDSSRWRGMGSYIRLALKVMWRKKLMHAHVITDGADLHCKAYMIVIANASKYGTGAVINPDGTVDDGIFEVVIMREFTLVQLFKMFLSYKNFNPKHVEILKTKKARIETTKNIHFQVDGEFKGKVKHVKAEIRASALNLLLPDF